MFGFTPLNPHTALPFSQIATSILGRDVPGKSTSGVTLSQYGVSKKQSHQFQFAVMADSPTLGPAGLFNRGLAMYPNASSDQIVGLVGEVQAVCEARKLSVVNSEVSVSYITNFRTRKPDFRLVRGDKVLASVEVKRWRFPLVTSSLVHSKIACKRWGHARRFVVFTEKIEFTRAALQALRKARIKIINGLDRLAATFRRFVREREINR